MRWFIECITKKYARFSGRASRQEYWYFILYAAIISTVIITAENIFHITFFDLPFGILFSLFAAYIVLPKLSVLTRRLHDIGKSGWWLFITYLIFVILALGIQIFFTRYNNGKCGWWCFSVFIILLIEIIILIIYACINSETGENKYGPSPKEKNEIKE